ncbi:three-helix bundle dimerization domain-containing protein [Leifsonia flava]|uniref:three-helix bundle dimerization domain-containing protein n=1 Tax=Orlajensenia leifsoniae TaxID=2561933 RepID=UPI003B83054F
MVERLLSRFPGAPRPVVENAVLAAERSFTGARVRGYLPVLVERAARTTVQLMGFKETRETRDTAGGPPGDRLPPGHVSIETILNAHIGFGD